MLCWVFSIVQRKDRPSYGTVLPVLLAEGTGRLPGKPERNVIPRKGENMAMARIGNGFQPPAYYIFSVHTAAPFKGAAAFSYPTYFCQFPNQITKEYIIFITGVPAILRVRFFFALRYAGFPPFRGRAPPFQS